MRVAAGVVGLVGLVALALALAPAAQGQGFGVQDFTGMVFADGERDRSNTYTNTGTPGGRITDAYPDPSTGGTGIYELAGGHPFIGVTAFSFNRTPDGPPIGGNVDNVRVDIPRGLMPNPRAFTRCTEAQLQASSCPLSSQIGTQEMTVHIGPVSETLLAGDITFKVPLYNTTPLSNPKSGPQEDVVARFAFDPAEAGEVVAPLPLFADLFQALLHLEPVHIVGGVRDEPSAFGPFDYGLYFTIEHLPALDPDDPLSPGVLASNLTFWGVPGDPAHNGERGRSCIKLENLPPLLQPCTPIPAIGVPPDPDVPFLSNPTECTGTSLVGKLTVFSAGNAASDSRTDQTPAIVDRDDGVTKQGAQECQQLGVAPGVGLDTGASGSDSPAGPKVDVTMAQEGLADKDRFAEAHAKDIVVTLPPGLTLNPSVANGLETCSDDQLAANVGVPGGEACPPASRVGDVAVDSPLLPPTAGAAPDSTPLLTGSAYVGQPLAGDRYRLFVTVEGRKVSIRLKGSIQPDPATGQLTAVFRDNPQLPFSRLSVDLRDGPRAPLATPNDCGLGQARVTVTPWSGTAPVAADSAPGAIPACAPSPFAPSFGASTGSSASGAFTSFTARIGREDRNQFLSGVRVDTPPGLAAKIKGVAKCPSAAAATGACPASSRIGTATTTAGAGSEPYRLSGPVYFTGAYKGAPFGMVAAIRAIAGPYDLGTVVVRQAIHVDPEDASLSVVSDPLPQIVEGVPIRLRTVDVTLDRRNFTYNPTSCGAKQVGSRLHSIQGTVADRSARMDFDRCARLGFAPKLKMALTGVRQLERGKHPGLSARLTQPVSQANIASARVVLPKSLALDPANARSVCGFEAAKQAKCPAKTRIGTAVARSPVLNKPLRGPVYFVQGIRIDPTTGAQIRTLPSLLAKLGGEIRVNLRATTDVARGRLVSTFANVPDAPVTRFDLKLKGGKGGVLAATGRPRICGRRQVAATRVDGHNGKRSAQRRAKVATPCKKAKRLRAKAKRRAARTPS
jgi:hypothetical protein